MVKQIVINASNRTLYTLITLLAVVMVTMLGIGVYALASGIDTSKGYHESAQVSVSVGGSEKTLQEAIDTGDFGGSGSVPSGMITMFDANCPSGWTRFSALDNKFPRGNTVANVSRTGGFADAIIVSHSHSGSASSEGSHSHSLISEGSGAWSSNDFVSPYQGGGSTGTMSAMKSAGAHSHSLSINSAGESGTGKNIPPYLNVIFCKKD